MFYVSYFSFKHIKHGNNMHPTISSVFVVVLAFFVVVFVCLGFLVIIISRNNEIITSL